MNTRTAALNPTTSLTDEVLAFVGTAGQHLARLIRMPAPGVPETTAALLRLAASYESTQPSYAADLRAAASMQERGDGPRR
jgi:hypothetical protein